MNSYLKKYGLTERFEQEATLYSGLFIARVTEQHRDLYKVISEQGELNASISGKLAYNADNQLSYPAVGDWVMIDRIDGTTGNAVCVLPDDLIVAIQQHIDGEYLYIPRKAERKKKWGELTNTKHFLNERNTAIFEEYQCGVPVEELAIKYYLSPKTVYKILAAIKYDK